MAVGRCRMHGCLVKPLCYWRRGSLRGTPSFGLHGTVVSLAVQREFDG